MSKWILAVLVFLVSFGGLATFATVKGWGLPTEESAISVRLDTPSVYRTHRGGTRSFGK